MEEYQKDAFRREMNFSALERMSAYLNNCPRAIDEGEVFEVMECGVSQEEAVLMLLAAVCGLDETRSPEERELIRRYFQPSLRRLDAQAYRQNPYLQTIRFPDTQDGRWRMTQLFYEPYELFVRDYISSSVDTSPGKLHSLAVGYVKAEAQAKALEMLLPMLLDEEKDIVRRGKNSSKMSVPKHADPKDYRSATALEALFGYLYILRRWDRLEELFQAVVRQNPIEY